MSENQYLVRAPLLDPRQHVMGYRLAWQNEKSGVKQPSDAGMLQVLAHVAAHASANTGPLFLDAGPALLSTPALKNIAPGALVLVLASGALLDADTVALAAALHEQGYGLALRDADLAFPAAGEVLLPLLKYVLLDTSHPDLAGISRLSNEGASPFSVVLERLGDWREFDDYAARGLGGFFGNLCFAPRKTISAGELGPQAALILQLMQMVQDNADVRLLENVLKRDATISYKLFRYINSAGFGIEVEIESLRHAVAMLGYTPLFRWLALLLATTSSTGFSPALMQAAIVRGRFAELLGQGQLPKSEAENLFFVGMFSLLDQLLGVPMQKVVNQILLPQAVTQALLSRGGVYGPFLALIEACEQDVGHAAAHADALFMTAAQVNQAHVSALAWAQNIKL